MIAPSAAPYATRGDLEMRPSALLDSPRARRWHAWIDRLGEGDMEACAAFYDDSAQLAFGVLMQVLREREPAEDALVDLYLEIRVRAGRREHRHRNPVAWLVSLARGVAAARAPRSLRPRRAGRVVAFEAAPADPSPDGAFTPSMR
jgi:RNA polymerase sigma-70 factor (ECF subfamily)